MCHFCIASASASASALELGLTSASVSASAVVLELAAYLRLSELAFTFAPALLLLDDAKLVGATGTGIVLASHSPVAGWITGSMAGWVDG